MCSQLFMIGWSVNQMKTLNGIVLIISLVDNWVKISWKNVYSNERKLLSRPECWTFGLPNSFRFINLRIKFLCASKSRFILSRFSSRYWIHSSNKLTCKFYLFSYFSSWVSQSNWTCRKGRSSDGGDDARHKINRQLLLNSARIAGDASTTPTASCLAWLSCGTNRGCGT